MSGKLSVLGSVARSLDSAIHWISRYPLDNINANKNNRADNFIHWITLSKLRATDPRWLKETVHAHAHAPCNRSLNLSAGSTLNSIL